VLFEVLNKQDLGLHLPPPAFVQRDPTLQLRVFDTDKKHWWVLGSRMGLGRGASGAGLCSEVPAIWEDKPWWGKREYVQTSQGQVSAIVPYL